MTQTYEVKKQQPIEGSVRPDGSYSRAKYPFASLVDVGDCFDVPKSDVRGHALRVRASKIGKSQGKYLSVYKQGDIYRVQYIGDREAA